MHFGAPNTIHECLWGDKIYKFRNVIFNQVHESGWYFHSEEILRHFHWNSRPGQVVVDVGACFGSYTIPAALDGAIVYAYEPQLFLYRELLENLELNNLRVMTVNKAAWSLSGEMLDLPLLDLSMMRVPSAIQNQPTAKVMTVALDDDLAKTDGLDLMKIDVEGAEIEVLRGARKLIEKFNPRIIVEWHADRNQDPNMDYIAEYKRKEKLEPGHYLIKLY
jgi:FkbM family methyltransferase